MIACHQHLIKMSYSTNRYEIMGLNPSLENCWPLFNTTAVAVAQSFTSDAEGWVCESQRDKPTSLKQGITAPLLNAQQPVWVSQVLRDDHNKRIPSVTIGLARLRTLNDQ